LSTSRKVLIEQMISIFEDLELEIQGTRNRLLHTPVASPQSPKQPL
jgi:hypothetical protein